MSALNVAAAPVTSEPAGNKRPIGLELYSVRGELAKDLPNTLKTVAKMGYEVVEFYSPYSKWKPPYAKDVRTQMDDLGLRCYSTHNGFESLLPGETMSRAIELNQILGARHIIMASAPRTTRGITRPRAATMSAATSSPRPRRPSVRRAAEAGTRRPL